MKLDVVYVPKGAALEYAPLAVNLYTGCSHGCKYCFAPACLHVTREEFSVPVARKGATPRGRHRLYLSGTCDTGSMSVV